MKAPKTREVVSVAAGVVFLGVIVFVVLTLADTFICSCVVAVPYLAICFLIHEGIQLWQQR